MRSLYLPSRTATTRLPSVVELVARCMSFLCGLSPGCGRTRWYIGERTGERGRQCTVGWPDRAERPVGSRSDKILRHSHSLDAGRSTRGSTSRLMSIANSPPNDVEILSLRDP